MFRQKSSKQNIVATLAIAALLLWAAGTNLNLTSAQGEENIPVDVCEPCHKDIVERFRTSLHHTVAGMANEWEKGAGQLAGVPLPTGCRACHIEHCTECHKAKEGQHMPGLDFDIEKEPELEVCVECHHSRVGVNYVGLTAAHTEGPSPDVHYERGLICTDCHGLDEIHGDGNEYENMKLAVKVRCENCHASPGATVRGMEVKQWDPEIAAHKIHAGKLHCAACHAKWMQNCYNCHIDVLLEQRKKKIDKTTVTDFYLGVGYEGKVKPFYSMWISYYGTTQRGWVEYVPHTISSEPHDCAFCHSAEAAVSRYPSEGVVLGPAGASFLPAEKVAAIAVIPAAQEPGCTVCHSDVGESFLTVDQLVEAAAAAVEQAKAAGVDVSGAEAKVAAAKEKLEVAEEKLHTDPQLAMQALINAKSVAEEALSLAKSALEGRISDLESSIAGFEEQVATLTNKFYMGTAGAAVVGIVTGVVLSYLVKRKK